MYAQQLAKQLINGHFNQLQCFLKFLFPPRFCNLNIFSNVNITFIGRNAKSCKHFCSLNCNFYHKNNFVTITVLFFLTFVVLYHVGVFHQFTVFYQFVVFYQFAAFNLFVVFYDFALKNIAFCFVLTGLKS